jgi:rSAM/selenodomain-associated transferase 1
MTRLVVFLRAPRPGTVKTRLARSIGLAEACAVYRQLVDWLVPQIAAASLGVELRFTPDDAAAEIEPWRRPGWTLAPQGSGDLGARMWRAVTENRAGGADRVLIIGTDCPGLRAADLLAAAAALDANELVLGPAQDGGYWLIGLRAAQRRLFEDIPWSTARVLETTLERARQDRLGVHLLRTLSDIDTAEDWEAFLTEQRQATGD